jgi:ribosomal protein L14E/L6E/L27E
MDFVRGLVVRSNAGRDRGGFFVVLEADARYAVVCDGKRRSLSHPKRKSRKHLSSTATALPASSIETNREIRCALKAFQTGGRFPHEEAYLCRNRT